jgi:hypothetical protein
VVCVPQKMPPTLSHEVSATCKKRVSSKRSSSRDTPP